VFHYQTKQLEKILFFCMFICSVWKIKKASDIFQLKINKRFMTVLRSSSFKF
jgi:hypothetical protein